MTQEGRGLILSRQIMCYLEGVHTFAHPPPHECGRPQFVYSSCVRAQYIHNVLSDPRILEVMDVFTRRLLKEKSYIYLANQPISNSRITKPAVAENRKKVGTTNGSITGQQNKSRLKDLFRPNDRSRRHYASLDSCTSTPVPAVGRRVRVRAGGQKVEVCEVKAARSQRWRHPHTRPARR
ncbi:hypothetical protein J6590_034923 [Homalodisca vitripennis]|nr:hypothetical protein J6590_034923 [Homalodisca vitripennis]